MLKSKTQFICKLITYLKILEFSTLTISKLLEFQKYIQDIKAFDSLHKSEKALDFDL